MQNDLHDPIKLLRQLKGAPLAVLLAMIIARSRVSADWLATVTGYTDKPVTNALKLLSAYGWIGKAGGGWQITQGVQLPLMFGESEKFRTGSSSSHLFNNDTTTEQEQEDRKNSDSYLRNYRTLKACGIREPACSRLSALEHVTPEFVLAHVRQVRSERGNLGTAIHRIENNWDAPEVKEEQNEFKRYTGGMFAGYFSRGDEEGQGNA